MLLGIFALEDTRGGGHQGTQLSGSLRRRRDEQEAPGGPAVGLAAALPKAECLLLAAPKHTAQLGTVCASSQPSLRPGMVQS
jgi:hypothetical protein